MNDYSIYVHIPFCCSKCYYCDFCSFVDNQKNIDNYFKKSEIDKIMLGRFAKKEEIADAIYFMVSNEYVNDCVLKIDGGIK